MIRRIEKFTPDDLTFVAHQDLPGELVIAGFMECSKRPQDYCMMSCFLGDRLFAVMGVRRLHIRCGEVFVIPMGKIPPIAFHKCARDLIRYAFTELGYNRLQATTKANSAKDQAWARSQGFDCEGILKGFDPITKQDHMVYGRVA